VLHGRIVDEPHNLALSVEGMDLVAWVRAHVLRPECPLAGPDDMTIPGCVGDGPAILRLIREHPAGWKKAQGWNR
jgi:hypothetical protein